MTKEINPRFFGISRLLGESKANRLGKAHVCVVGLGGVGSWVVEALTRSGIGELTLVDLDEVCVSNVNRQIQALDGTFGKLKSEVLAERMRAINPEIRIHCVNRFFTETTADEILGEGYDFLVDAIDTFANKCFLIATCKRRKQPFVTVGTAGGRTDPTKIRVSDLNKCENDPLVAIVRKKLRRVYGFHRNKKKNFQVPCVWSQEKPKYYHSYDAILEEKPDFGEGGTRLDCTGGFGSATFITGTFGFFAAAYVIEKLTSEA